MRRAISFAKRNLTESLRDPVIYVFCAGFPVLMLVMFSVIGHFAGENASFDLSSLIPGIMMFSLSFVMLVTTLLVSKDKSTALLLRLYTSPMRVPDFLIGYTLPAAVVGLAQQVICIICGFIIALIRGDGYFSFGRCCLLLLSVLPMMFTFIFLGILLGTVLNDKSGPGVSSVLITACGVLGGAWMPLDTMGGLESACRALPFYPTVVFGRIITGASHTIPTDGVYTLDSAAALGFIPVLAWLLLSFALAATLFGRMTRSDNK